MHRKDLIQFVPLLIGYLIFCSITRLVIYYHFFNISIVPFLEFSEILTSFLDIIVLLPYLVVLSGTGILIVMYFIIIVRKWHLRKHKKKLWLTRFIYEEFFNSSKIYFGVSIFICFVASSLRYDAKDASFWIVAFRNIFGIWFFILLAKPYLFISGKFFLVRRFSKSIKSVIIVFFIFTIINAFLEVIATIDSEKRINVSFETIYNKKITTDSLNYYLGNTSKYLFLYNSKSGSTSVYPMSDIKSLEFKSKSATN
jgi:hypothetical protein